jgi:hypothetical protein
MFPLFLGINWGSMVYGHKNYTAIVFRFCDRCCHFPMVCILIISKSIKNIGHYLVKTVIIKGNQSRISGKTANLVGSGKSNQPVCPGGWSACLIPGVEVGYSLNPHCASQCMFVHGVQNTVLRGYISTGLGWCQKCHEIKHWSIGYTVRGVLWFPSVPPGKC